MTDPISEAFQMISQEVARLKKVPECETHNEETAATRQYMKVAVDEAIELRSKLAKAEEEASELRKENEQLMGNEEDRKTKKEVMRDPREDPRPGDEIVGPQIKAKVLAITIGESGTLRVRYNIAPLGVEYQGDGRDVPLARWKQFSELREQEG